MHLDPHYTQDGRGEPGIPGWLSCLATALGGRGYVQVRLVWAEGRQAFPEHPREMAGGRGGPRIRGLSASLGWAQGVHCPRLRAWLPSCGPWRLLAAVLWAPAPIPPDLCTELTHMPFLLVTTLLPLDSASSVGKCLEQSLSGPASASGPCFPHVILVDIFYPHWL